MNDATSERHELYLESNSGEDEWPACICGRSQHYEDTSPANAWFTAHIDGKP